MAFLMPQELACVQPAFARAACAAERAGVVGQAHNLTHAPRAPRLPPHPCTEYREELKDLGAIVANCTSFIFILTDNVFDSSWCMEELRSAVEHNLNIVLVVKDGAR